MQPYSAALSIYCKIEAKEMNNVDNHVNQSTRGKCISVTDAEGRKTHVKKLLLVTGLESSTSFSISFKAGRLK